MTDGCVSPAVHPLVSWYIHSSLVVSTHAACHGLIEHSHTVQSASTTHLSRASCIICILAPPPLPLPRPLLRLLIIIMIDANFPDHTELFLR